MNPGERFNWLTWMLASVTVALGASTVYYSRALKVEQQRVVSRVPSSRSVAVDTPARHDAPVATTTEPVAVNSNPAVAPKLDKPPARDPGDIAVARDRLQRQNPQQEQEQLRQMVDATRAFLIPIASQVGISTQDVDRIVELLAKSGIQGERRLLECRADPACDPDALETSMEKEYLEKAARAVGQDKMDRIQAYADAELERMYVKSIRERTSVPGKLSDEAVNSLAMALAEERKRFVRDAASAGEKVQEIHGRGPVSGLMLQSAAMPGASDEAERRIKSLTEYSKRLVDRATGVLDQEGLALFKDSMSATIESFSQQTRRSQKEREIAAEARRAAQP